MPASKARRLARASNGAGATSQRSVPEPTAIDGRTVRAEVCESSTTSDADSKKRVTSTDSKESQGRLSRSPKQSTIAGRISCTLFIGQLPYSASAADVRRHFKQNGVVGGIQVRLRTARDGSSRGTAFVEFDTEADVHTGLRLHHSVFSGRRINVERTVGGGGSLNQRKEKLANLRERQGQQMRQVVDALIQSVLPSPHEISTVEDDDGHSPITQADVDDLR